MGNLLQWLARDLLVLDASETGVKIHAPKLITKFIRQRNKQE